ncbi:hypothetical protein HYV80_07010 [Candidatus Woesearchaeota archaeon]|nr:hypothetical protein [Candidatus Woesearchaeota archaeon]
MGELSPDKLALVVTELSKAGPIQIRVSIDDDGSAYEISLNGDRHTHGSLTPPIMPKSFRDILQPNISSDYLCGKVVYDKKFTATPPQGHIYLTKKAEPINAE